MPTDVAEDSLDLKVELLEAVEPTGSSYPFPALQRTGRIELRSFQVAVLENAYLQVTIAPDLGGRIIRWVDKRTGLEVIPFNPILNLTDSEVRGTRLSAGIQVVTGKSERLNSMGYVAHQPDYGPDEDGPSALWWGELCGNGLSLNVRVNLPPEEAALEIEVRAFNRSLEPILYDGGLTLQLGDGVLFADDLNFLYKSQASGLHIQSSDIGFAYADVGQVALHRFGRLRSLSPRQLDSWSVRLTPYTGQLNLLDASPNLAMEMEGCQLRLQSSSVHEGAKVVLQTKGQQVMEAPVSLDPATPAEFDLSKLPDDLEELAVLGSDRAELFRWNSNLIEHVPYPGDDEPLALQPIDPEASVRELVDATFDVGHRHVAHILLGYRSLANKYYAEASHQFEQALLFNAEDHLTWWAKAVAERLGGSTEDERSELLNAHFLAPMEPTLRAESYLASPSQTKEKSAVLNPLEQTPDAFIEVACLLIEAGLNEEAAKWLDESIRHIDLPMLRYLLAYTYLRGSRMGVEAGEHIAAAGRLGLRPPYPFRAVEKECLRALSERFPEDAGLRGMMPPPIP